MSHHAPCGSTFCVGDSFCCLVFAALAVIDVIIGDDFTFDDLFDPQYKPRHFVSTWVTGGWTSVDVGRCR